MRSDPLQQDPLPFLISKSRVNNRRNKQLKSERLSRFQLFSFGLSPKNGEDSWAERRKYKIYVLRIERHNMLW